MKSTRHIPTKHQHYDPANFVKILCGGHEVLQVQEPHEMMDDIKRPVLPNFFPTFRVLHLWVAGCMLVETVLPSENRVMVSKIFDRRQLRKRQENEPQFMPNSPEWDKEAKSHSCFLCHAKRQF